MQRKTARRVNTHDLGNHDRKKRQCSPMIMIAIKGLHPIEPISWLQKVSVYEDYCRPSVNFLSLLCLFTKHTHEKDQSPVTPNPFPAPTPKNPASPPPPCPRSPQQPNPPARTAAPVSSTHPHRTAPAPNLPQRHPPLYNSIKKVAAATQKFRANVSGHCSR